MKVAVVGFGVVGSGVAEVLRDNAAAIEKRCGFPVELGYIVDLREPAAEWKALWCKDLDSVLADSDVGVVVEAIGGLHPAYDFTKAALNAGKHVVSSNKELVATLGTDLLETAKANNVNYYFEAAVGGGIPLLQPVARLLGTEEITDVIGILNGTTNFIMTRMNEDKMTFADALSLAQKNGYAEADPTADIEGHDACRKTAILASIIGGHHVAPNEVYTEGITKLTAEDTAAASAAGCVIKLLGQVRATEKGTLAQVTPMLVPADSPIGVTKDVFNAAFVRGTHLGDAMFYGRGAGKLPTANAVVSDVVEAVTAGGYNGVFSWDDGANGLCDALEAPFVWMLRVNHEDSESASEIFGAQPMNKSVGAESILFTMKMSYNELNSLKNEAEARGVKVLSALRMLDF